MFTGFDRGRCTMNQPANWNSPPNKSPLYICECAGGTHASSLRVNAMAGGVASASSFSLAPVSLGKRTLFPCATVETDYSGTTIVQITKHARHGETQLGSESGSDRSCGSIGLRRCLESCERVMVIDVPPFIRGLDSH